MPSYAEIVGPRPTSPAKKSTPSRSDRAPPDDGDGDDDGGGMLQWRADTQPPTAATAFDAGEAPSSSPSVPVATVTPTHRGVTTAPSRELWSTARGSAETTPEYHPPRVKSTDVPWNSTVSPGGSWASAGNGHHSSSNAAAAAAALLANTRLRSTAPEYRPRASPNVTPNAAGKFSTPPHAATGIPALTTSSTPSAAGNGGTPKPHADDDKALAPTPATGEVKSTSGDFGGVHALPPPLFTQSPGASVHSTPHVGGGAPPSMSSSVASSFPFHHSLPPPSAGAAGGSQTSLPFFVDFILVIDFEATCEEPQPSGYVPEIIEFPVVAIDAAKRTIVGEFQSYVRPIEKPVLSPFCNQLTGISQEDVSAAPHLPEVLRKFDRWLADIVAEGKSFIFATDGPWDLRDFMYNASVKHYGVRFPEAFYRWIDVKEAFSEFFACRRGKIHAMLDVFGLQFEGRLHSGIDDARNIARIVIALLDAGCPFHTIDEIEVTPPRAHLRRYRAGGGGPHHHHQHQHFQPHDYAHHQLSQAPAPSYAGNNGAGGGTPMFGASSSGRSPPLLFAGYDHDNSCEGQLLFPPAPPPPSTIGSSTTAGFGATSGGSFALPPPKNTPPSQRNTRYPSYQSPSQGPPPHHQQVPPPGLLFAGGSQHHPPSANSGWNGGSGSSSSILGRGDGVGPPPGPSAAVAAATAAAAASALATQQQQQLLQQQQQQARYHGFDYSPPPSSSSNAARVGGHRGSGSGASAGGRSPPSTAAPWPS